MRFLTIILVCISSFLSAQTETKIHLGQINGSGATDGQFAKWNAGTGKWEPVSGTLLPTGTTGQTLRWDGSGWVANSLLYNDGTNVGVGTTVLQNKINIAGNMSMTPLSGLSRYLLLDDGGDAAFYTGTMVIQSGRGSAGHGGAINLFSHAHSTKPGWVTAGISSSAGSGATEGRFTVNNQGIAGGTDVFTVLRSGKVGIGTTSFLQVLDINGDIHMNASALIDLGTIWNTGVFKIQNAGTTIFAVDVPTGTPSLGVNPYFGVKALHGFMGGDGAVQYPTYGFTAEQGLGMYRPASGELGWVTGNLEKMRMNGLGYFGIGTTNPIQKIDIAAGNINLSNDQYLMWGGSNANRIEANASSNYIRLLANSAEAVRINSSGVGIFTTTPNKKLTVKGAIGIQDPAGASRVLLNAAAWDSTYMSLQNATLSEAIANAAIWQNSSGATSVNTAAGTSLGLRVNNVAIANVTATGFGIGTVPTESLTVSGKAVVTGSSASPSTTLTGRDASNVFGNVTVGTGLSLSSGSLAVNTTTLDGLYAKLGGNAIGTAVALGTTDAQNVSLGTNSTAGLIMNTSQRIGVKGSPVANVGLAVFDSTAVQGSSNSFATGYGVEGKKSGGSGAGIRGFATGPSGAFISGGDFDADSTSFSNAILRLDDHGSVSGKWNIHGASYWPSFLWGKLLVGPFTTTTNTAWVNLGGGSTATAPLRFTAGTNLTTPEAGAVEFDGTNYFATSGSTRYTLAKTLTATAALDFPSTISGSVSDLTITVTGAVLGDVVSIGVPNGSVTATALFTAWVSATNTVTVRFMPHGVEDPANGTFRVSVLKY